MTRSEQTKLRLSKSVNSQDMTVINIWMERQKIYLILINYNQWWQRSSDQQLPPTLTRCTRKREKKNLKYIRIWLIFQLRHFWNWTAIVESVPHTRMVLFWGSQAKIPPLEPWQHLYKIRIRSNHKRKLTMSTSESQELRYIACYKSHKMKFSFPIYQWLYFNKFMNSVKTCL